MNCQSGISSSLTIAAFAFGTSAISSSPAVPLFGEIPTIIQLIGYVLILSGVIIVVTAGSQTVMPDVDNALKYQITAIDRDRFRSSVNRSHRIADSIRTQKIDSEEQPYGTNIPSNKLQLRLEWGICLT